MKCNHTEFDAKVTVIRLGGSDKDPVNGYMAEVRIRCNQCAKPFQFLGLEPGCDTQGARVSVDGLEANLAISPEGEQPNPMQRMAYGIKAFDS